MAYHSTDLSALFLALSDATRRDVLANLARGPASVGDLAEPFDMALPSFMGHLKKLEEVGLIETTKEGRVRHCNLRPDALVPVRAWLDEQRDIWEARLDRMDDYVINLMKERENGSGSEN